MTRRGATKPSSGPRLATREETDALRELGNVAFSHAATALSALTGRRVDVSMPNLRVMMSEEVDDEFAAKDDPIYIISLRILGEQQGLLALVFPQDDAVALVEMLEGAPRGSMSGISHAGEGVLAELANIMSGAALLSMYRFLKISLIHGTPVIRLRMRGSAEHAEIRTAWSSELAIVVETEFGVGEDVARGEMIITLSDLPFFLDALAMYGGD